MHGLNTIIALNRRQQAAHDARVIARPAAPRYVSYEYAPVRELGRALYGVTDMVRCAPDDATAWTVYGRDADGLANAICDCLDEASADSAVALLNALLKFGPSLAPPAVDTVHTFVDELRDTCDLYHGGRQLTPVEKQVQRYAEILLAMVSHADLNKLAPVFPLERR